MSAFKNTDSPLAASSPLLTFPEPARFLNLSTLRVLCRPTRNRKAFDSHLLDRRFVCCRMERRIRGDEIRNLSEPVTMFFNGLHQKVRIVRSRPIDFVTGDDLIFRFLDLHHSSKLGRLARLAFTDHF